MNYPLDFMIEVIMDLDPLADEKELLRMKREDLEWLFDCWVSL